MIERALGHAGQVVATLLVSAVLAGAGFAALVPQRLSAVPADLPSRPDARHGLATPSQSPSPSAVAAGADDSSSLRTAKVAPYLLSVEPKTIGVLPNAVIVMSFSQPMNRESVEASFAILPTVEGHFVWADQWTMRFEPFRLEYGTTYQVDVGGRSLQRVGLGGWRQWSFTTVSAAPNVLAPGPRSINVPILMYHYIRVNPERNDRLGYALSVTPADFAAQMDWLAQNGYHPITTEDLYGYLVGARGLPSKPVILTFDDGYADFFMTALPILRSHNFVAVAYVVSGFVGRPGYMTAAQVREADRSGIEIGSHSATHADLARISVGSLRNEIVESKQFLEQLLGHPVWAFCYPSGKFNSRVAQAVADAGYHDATTTYYGYAHNVNDRYQWTRLRVSGGEGLGAFAAAARSAS